jgi:hypothetical protein
MVQPRAPSDDDLPEPRRLRRLRLLVSLLMVVLIVGMVAVVAAMVIRLGTFSGFASTPVPISADDLTLPAGAEVVAVGQGASGVLIVTRAADGAETLRVFDPATGAETSATPIRRE